MAMVNKIVKMLAAHLKFTIPSVVLAGRVYALEIWRAMGEMLLSDRTAVQIPSRNFFELSHYKAITRFRWSLSAMGMFQQLTLPECGCGPSEWLLCGMISGYPLSMVFFFRSVQ
jgi:hypothetical protein